jgi:hypothetical protein
LQKIDLSPARISLQFSFALKVSAKINVFGPTDATPPLKAHLQSHYYANKYIIRWHQQDKNMKNHYIPSLTSQK